MAFSLPSFAKINITLRVLGRREDGYHEVFTVLRSISLADELWFEDAETGIQLSCDDAEIPLDAENLVVRAAEKLQEHFRISKGAKIHLRKNIPAGGGLGGGSSNAAVTLIGLDRLWQLGASNNELGSIASEIGVDVPFFLYGGTMIGTGRGDQLEAIAGGDEDLGHILVITPRQRVATARAYSLLRAENLTIEEANRILRVCRSEANSSGFLRRALRNDLETAVFPAFPEIERAKEALLSLGAEESLMSGSGSSVFGIFEKDETRQAALKALGNEANWRKFAVAAVSRSEYREKVYGGL